MFSNHELPQTPIDRSTTAPKSRRIVLHSHDSYGLGHLRRTMTIAEALRGAIPGAQILITTGSPCATHFPHRDGIDIVKLPSATKDGGGRYVPRSLGHEIGSLLALRRGILKSIQKSFAPHLMIVDHQVLGLADELDGVLRDARERGTRTILGVRDIIDAPEVVAREWGRSRVRQALSNEYDRVCVYGAPQVFDPRHEYPIPPELSQRLEFTGYIARALPTPQPDRARSARPHVLVTVGGGEDGAMRIETYLECLELEMVPWDSTIVLGPLFDPQQARSYKRRVRAIRHVALHSFHRDLPRLLSQSDAVVSMAGYNSVVEILQSRVSAILCPRSFPRREQLMRAERLAALGLVDCLPVPTPERLRAALATAIARGPVAGPEIPLDGCRRLCAIAAELMAERTEQRARTVTR